MTNLGSKAIDPSNLSIWNSVALTSNFFQCSQMSSSFSADCCSKLIQRFSEAFLLTRRRCSARIPVTTTGSLPNQSVCPDSRLRLSTPGRHKGASTHLGSAIFCPTATAESIKNCHATWQLGVGYVWLKCCNHHVSMLPVRICQWIGFNKHITFWYILYYTLSCTRVFDLQHGHPSMHQGVCKSWWWSEGRGWPVQ